jgi:agmatinase
MTLPLSAIPREGFTSFLGLPIADDPRALDADIAILGIPYGVPYAMSGVSPGTALAPGAIRAASDRYHDTLDHYDFDLDGPLLDGRDVRIVDCGDVPADPRDIPGNMARATAAVQAILARGTVPIVLGGDDSIPIPFFRAYEGRGPITVVQIDAHIDWRHEVDGVTEGFSSPMRRAAEMPWIEGIVHVGIRGVGSARSAEVADARAFGATIITAREVHTRGAGHVLHQVPGGADYLLTIDGDGLDPAVMPGAGAPAPGGLTYYQVVDIVHGLARKGRVVGCDVVELDPTRDANGVAALTAGRIICNLIGALARTGRFDRR